MPTNKTKAAAFVRNMSKHEADELKLHGIDSKDVTISIRVDVLDQVTYHNHEDED